jgi:alpha-D-ribose 1-methylphosphonate 5-triphosphate synthase subunit PhnH
MSMASGLNDYVHDSQRTFRSVLEALSLPGRILRSGLIVEGIPIGAAMSHILLTLADSDTKIWWSPFCEESENCAQWLRFHTGAVNCASMESANFAVITQAETVPAFNFFSLGSDESPHTSCTLLIELSCFESGPMVEWRGPGIANHLPIRLGGLPHDFWLNWQKNHVSFPKGIDVIFTCGEYLIGLPRTTRVSRVEGI